MNKKSTGVILTVAIILGVGTALAVFRYIESMQVDSEKNQREVVMATTAIKPRTQIHASMVALEKVKEGLTTLEQVLVVTAAGH